jgi:hypothetical protein
LSWIYSRRNRKPVGQALGKLDLTGFDFLQGDNGYAHALG